jgi:hypothetical protein
MTCGVSSRRVPSDLLSRGKRAAREARAAGQAKAAPKDMCAAFEIAGTWDFKWPLGSKIRIAFQKLPPGQEQRLGRDDFRKAKEAVMVLARSWQLPPTLTLDFQAYDLEPPFEEVDSDMDRHRSAFLPEEVEAKPYDVLISLQNLPVVKVDPFRGAGCEKEEVALPVSALGSYARRADYGAPTMYLGRFGRFIDDDFVGYFHKPLVKNIVVHEFGHMLGLPHLHQHPHLIAPKSLSSMMRERIDQLDKARGAFYKSTEDVKRMLSGVLGIEIPPEVVEDHLIRVWRGNEAFSDWPALSEEMVASHAANAELDSIMTFPYYASTRREADDCARCDTTDAVYEAFKHVRVTPGSRDTEMLARMYVP